MTYGVQFGDGSVAHRWNGRTERQRAEEYLAYLRELYAPDRFTLVYRAAPGSPWVPVSNQASRSG